MSSFERVIALGLMLVGAMAVYVASRLSLWSGYTVGPGAAPIAFGSGVVICAALIALKPSSTEDFSLGPHFPRAVVLVISLAGLALIASYIGFAISIFLFALIAQIAVMRVKTVPAVIFSVAWTGLLYVVFVHLLKIPFPTGLLV